MTRGAGGSLPGLWNVYFHGPARSAIATPKGLKEVVDQIQTRHPVKTGTPYLLDPEGRPDGIINDFFRFGPGSGHSKSTMRTYAYSISGYLNLLHRWGIPWQEADPDDFADVRDYRLHGEDNPRTIKANTFDKDLAAISALYRYATAHGVLSPIPEAGKGYSAARASGGSRADVKWFAPGAVDQWRDVGVMGMLPDGAEDVSFRVRSVQRNAAFVNGLYRSGLRVRELSSVLLDWEWPTVVESGRPWKTVRLADAAAKGGRGRDYWVPRGVRMEVAAYVLGERAEAVSRAQAQGRYEADSTRLRVLDMVNRDLTLIDASGQQRRRSLDGLDPDDRRRLYVETPTGLEPAMLWLNVDGRPRKQSSWETTFDRANKRIENLGLPMSRLTPHHLRHSFALRWFSVARLLWQQRVTGLNGDQAADLMEQMGTHWGLVQTMLGHRSEETTKGIYLEPFQSLDVQLLLDHAADESVNDLLRAALAAHPRVQSPLYGFGEV